MRSSRDKNEGTYRSGGEGDEPGLWRWIEVASREGERERKRAKIVCLG